MVAAGAPGDPGAPGASIVWLGAFDYAFDANPEFAGYTPQPLWAYHNRSTGNSYIFSGAEWNILGAGGALGPAGPQGDPGQNAQVVYVTGIGVNINSIALPVGDRVVLTATLTPSNATVQTVLWESNDPNVRVVRLVPAASSRFSMATGVSVEIMALGVTNGSATITATAFGSGATAVTANVAVDIVPVTAVPGTFVYVEGGTFPMGRCPRTGNDLVTPVRNVTVNGFYMSRFQLTQGEWYDVMGVNPGNFTLAGEAWRNLPVENVSWFDAVEFANELSRRAGHTPAYTITGDTVTWNRGANGYRLPTEAEWEFAARGGTLSQGFEFAGGNDEREVGWLWANSRNRTHPVGMRQPNELGLYDMSGNVWEWVWDRDGAYPAVDETDPAGPESPAGRGINRVVRGGCFTAFWSILRPVTRSNRFPSIRDNNVGFRLVR